MRPFPALFPNVVEKRQCIVCECVNRANRFFNEPKPDRRIELSLYGIFSRQDDSLLFFWAERKTRKLRLGRRLVFFPSAHLRLIADYSYCLRQSNLRACFAPLCQ